MCEAVAQADICPPIQKKALEVPDIVAISVLFSNLLESAHNIAKIVKKVKKSTTVILGGNHISNAIIDYKYTKVDKRGFSSLLL